MLLSFLSFFSARDLQAPSANRRETLPRDRMYVQFSINQSIDQVYDFIIQIPTVGASQTNLKAKTCKIRVDFGQLQTLIANISGTDRNDQIRKTNVSTAIRPAFGEKVR